MLNGNGNALWRTIALMACSALGGCISTAYSIGHSSVTRSDVSQMIATESAYAQDKNDIYNRLGELRSGQQEENQKLDALIEALSAKQR
ncbi:MAG: hypothetical protein WAN10_12790 [Candidatus Acidiferrales bacterium]